jgi:hypothetical protein
MKCPNHPDKDVLSFCHSCGEYLCRECLVDGEEYYFCKKDECQNKMADEKANDEHYENDEHDEQVDMEPKENLIKFASFLSLLDADLAKMRLEAAGVKCFIFDQNLIQMNWLYSTAVGGVKLYIKADDLEKAQEIMEVEPEKFDVDY